MFSSGDTIVHNRYGAGTVVGEKTITLDGETRHYICIQLAGERGTLMVQPDEINPEEVRTTINDLKVIREVFANTPVDLSDQHRARQSRLQAKIRSNDPRKIAQAIRDLIWRERTSRLTETDKRILSEAHDKLLQELSISPSIESARARLKSVIDAAIDKHLAKHEPEVATAS